MDLKFLPQDHGISVKNEIGGISLKFMKLQPQNDFEDAATHLRLETNVTKIHVCFNIFYSLYKLCIFCTSCFTMVLFLYFFKKNVVQFISLG
jgi:hypothetical protein